MYQSAIFLKYFHYLHIVNLCENSLLSKYKLKWIKKLKKKNWKKIDVSSCCIDCQNVKLKKENLDFRFYSLYPHVPLQWYMSALSTVHCALLCNAWQIDTVVLSKLGYQWVMTSKPVEVRVPITELHYVGWAKIKANSNRQQTRTDVITH